LLYFVERLFWYVFHTLGGRSMKSKIFKLLLILPIISFLTSCLRYNEETTLYKDFSGITTVEVLLPKMFADDKDMDETFYNLDKLEKEMKEKGDVELIKMKRAVVGPNMKVFIKYRFNSVDKMNALFTLFMDEFWKTGKLKEFTKVTYNGRKVKFERVIGNDEKVNSQDSEELAVFEELVKAGFTSSVMRFKIRFPYKVIETNGVMFEDDRTVEWAFTPYDFMTRDIKMKVKMERFKIFNKQNLFR